MSKLQQITFLFLSFIITSIFTSTLSSTEKEEYPESIDKANIATIALLLAAIVISICQFYLHYRSNIKLNKLSTLNTTTQAGSSTQKINEYETKLELYCNKFKEHETNFNKSVETSETLNKMMNKSIETAAATNKVELERLSTLFATLEQDAINKLTTCFNEQELKITELFKNKYEANSLKSIEFQKTTTASFIRRLTGTTKALDSFRSKLNNLALQYTSIITSLAPKTLLSDPSQINELYSALQQKYKLDNNQEFTRDEVIKHFQHTSSILNQLLDSGMQQSVIASNLKLKLDEISNSASKS